MPTSKLFDACPLGTSILEHKAVLSPMTRFRADNDGVPLPSVKTYYAQRASVRGTLLITEGVVICPRAKGFPNVPGIWHRDQIARWKEVVDEVHARGCVIWLQLWAAGRASDAETLASNGLDLESSSDVPLAPGDPAPRPLREEEIRSYILAYAQGAFNAVHEAGFDGVEIHAANGFLIDQFLQSSCNHRTDQWGGTIENRSRFGLEIARRVVDAVGKDRVGVKLSPWSTFQGMGTMHDLVPQFQHFITALRDMDIAYLHLANARWVEEEDPGIKTHPDVHNEAFVRTWGDEKPVILAGGYDADSARRLVDQTYSAKNNVLVAFGRQYISNPDLALRLKMNIALQKYNRDTFYIPFSEEGYVDYPFCKEYLRQYGIVEETK
uniref:Chanoclavine-I aldehyde oxidoreductase n=1 Tax=Claviceps paspali TaxID=40601 RepID=G8GV82_CLAPA|nr:chanoclavine-I aldehyde oxidoreductase [Claviceps paspali]